MGFGLGFFLRVVLFLNSGLLVLLVLADEIVHVRLSLSELHLVHSLASVPMQESLAAEHRRELISNTLEHLLDGGGVADEGGGHLETLGRNVADGGLDVVGDPLDEVRGVLVLHVQHLLVDLFGAHPAAEHGAGSEVAAVARVRGAHHVLGVEHLLGELGHGQLLVLLGAARGERGEADHEEVETREGHEVGGQLSEVGVELTGEAQAAGDARHGGGHQVVEVAVGGGRELQGAEADVVQGLVVDDLHDIGVFDQLVDRKSRVVGLDDGVGDLGGGEDGESLHDAVGVLFPDLGDEERAHAGAGSAAERVANLEALEAVAALRLFPDDVEDGVNEFRALGVVALGPVVSGAVLAENEVVGAEELAEGAGADGVHGAGLEVHQDRARNVTPASGLVVVDLDALEL